MNDIAMNKLVNLIKKMNDTSNSPDTMVFGTVKSISPLKIDIGNNVILTEEFLFLGQMCRPHKVTIPHTHKINVDTENAGATSSATGVTNKGDLSITTTGQAVTTVIEVNGHKHNIQDQETDNVHKENCGTDFEKSVTIEIEPKLQNGDIVLMFAFNHYQKYYVAERIEKE